MIDLRKRYGPIELRPANRWYTGSRSSLRTNSKRTMASEQHILQVFFDLLLGNAHSRGQLAIDPGDHLLAPLFPRPRLSSKFLQPVAQLLIGIQNRPWQTCGPSIVFGHTCATGNPGPPFQCSPRWIWASLALKRSRLDFASPPIRQQAPRLGEYGRAPLRWYRLRTVTVGRDRDIHERLARHCAHLRSSQVISSHAPTQPVRPARNNSTMFRP